MAHDDGRHKQSRRIPAMEPHQAVEDAFAVLVAQLVAGDQRDEDKAHEDRGHQHPQQRIVVVAAGHAHVHDVAGAEPGQHDDDAGPEGAQELRERARNRRPGIGRSWRAALGRCGCGGAHGGLRDAMTVY